MRKTSVALAALFGLSILAVPTTAHAAACTVKTSTVLGEASAKTTAVIYPLNNDRIHRVVFIFPTAPTQDVTKVRGRSTVHSYEAPRYVLAFRGDTICKTGSMVGVG